MNAHSDQHEELLRRLLCRELAPDAPPAAELLRACPVCRAEWERLSSLDATLASLGTEQRSDLALARAEADRNDEARVRRSFEVELERGGPRRAGRARWARFGWVAAAAILLLSLWLVRGSLFAPLLFAPSTPAPDFLLGRVEGPIECLAPLGPSASYDEFRWRDERPPSGWFRLTIHPLEVQPDGGLRIGAPVVTEEVSEDRWHPTEELARSLPSPLRYEVQALDANGTVVPGLRGAGSASR